MLHREIYITELKNGDYRLSAYVGANSQAVFIDHSYEGSHLETLIDDFKLDNPEYKDIGVSRE